jgi:hypothetical protein
MRGFGRARQPGAPSRTAQRSVPTIMRWLDGFYLFKNWRPYTLCFIAIRHLGEEQV